jgi:titin
MKCWERLFFLKLDELMGILLFMTARETIQRETQVSEQAWSQLQRMESYSKFQRSAEEMETQYPAPKFSRTLKQEMTEKEGRSVHLEAQLSEPISDPSLKIDWLKDGRALTASSRITTIYNFGYISLNIMHLRQDDAGQYTARVVNNSGEISSTTVLRVEAVSQLQQQQLAGVEGFTNYQAIEELEAYKNISSFSSEILETFTAPEFKSHLKDQVDIREGGFAHFEARLEPIGDDSMKVTWYKDNRQIEASSRITTFFNFGYVALTIKQVTAKDAGTYTVVATNKQGQAKSTSSLTVMQRQETIITDTSHEESLAKIQHLESRTATASSSRSVIRQEEVKLLPPPRFLGPLKCTSKIREGQRAHFETRLEPQSDTTMRIIWLLNGQPLQPATRIQTHHDFGYVALDISSVRLDDSGKSFGKFDSICR